MAYPNSVQSAVDAFGKGAGMQKHHGAWYGTSPETWTVVHLQKSDYGRRYYINFGFWLRAAGDIGYPKEHEFHIRSRLSAFFADLAPELASLLDLEADVPDEVRSQRLEEILRRRLMPVLQRGASLGGLQEMYRSDALKHALIRGEALTALRAAPT